MDNLKQFITELYGQKNADFQYQRYIEIGKKFEQKYGEYDLFVSSSGRIEICGNHTDHNHGIALASGIDLDTVGAVKKVDGNVIIIDSEGYSPVTVDITNLDKKADEEGTSIALTKGICRFLVDKGYKIGGFTAYTQSRVFKGAGVSSSASFELLIGKILSALFNDDKISAEELVQGAHFAENVYFGKPCGLLDQTAIGMGGISYIDFFNPAEPEVEKIEVDFDNLSIVLVNTGGDHSDLTGAYADVRGEMESIANHFGKSYLKEVKREDFLAELPVLCEKFSGRCVMRAEHFFRENDRVERAKTALLNKNFNEFYQIINESGDSSYKLLQNCYVEGDRAQRIPLALCVADNLDGIYAKRVHGGGFAGTVILFVNAQKSEGVISGMSRIFGKENVFSLNVRKYGPVVINKENI